MDSRFSEPIASRDESGDNDHALLCEVCKGLGDCNPHSKMFGRRHGGTYIHHRNLITLKYSAQTGCQMCQLLFDCLKEKEGFDTVLAEAQELELRRGSLMSSGLSFDSKRDTDEAAEIVRSIGQQQKSKQASEDSQSVAQEQKSEQREKITKLKTRIANLGRVAKALCKGGGHDKVKTHTSIQGRIVISFHDRELRDKPSFQHIEVRVCGAYASEIYGAKGIWKTLEVLVSTGWHLMPTS